MQAADRSRKIETAAAARGATATDVEVLIVTVALSCQHKLNTILVMRYTVLQFRDGSYLNFNSLKIGRQSIRFQLRCNFGLQLSSIIDDKSH